MSKETAFLVFCLENYKVHKSLTGKQAMELFCKYGVFDYLKDFYDILHTTGYQYINNDIDIYLKTRYYHSKLKSAAIKNLADMRRKRNGIRVQGI